MVPIYTLYCQKYLDPPPDHWIQVFQSPPWPHQASRPVALRLLLQTFVKEWVALRSSVTKRGTVIGCHLCNKSIHYISRLLNIPWSTVSGIITEWK
ncbi:unnamed protein product [Staurois parvus]|uniref:Uncharacterized protein n=1 Tax=Staurois parvus TaxID=386267 RepID=A0ABN9D0H4_9NEOB|nr:unnamed protein product [Staurois parvus]